MIRVSLISRYLHPFVLDDANYLIKKNVDVILASEETTEHLTPNKVKHVQLNKTINPKTILNLFSNALNDFNSVLHKPHLFFWSSLVVPTMSSIVEKTNSQIIHAHFAYPEGFIGYLTKKKTDRPLVISLHGYDILTEKSVNYGLRLNKRFDELIKFVLNYSDAIIAPSRAVLSETQKIVKDTNKIKLIHHGVDTKIFNPKIDGSKIKTQLGIEESNKVILTLKNHEPQYGIEFLIRAANIVAKQNKNVVFVVVGDGSLRGYHQKLVHDLNLESVFVFRNRIPKEQVPLYCAMSDVVVTPSLQESFGLTVTEAMSCGKPVIGSNVGGIPDQIIDGYNGFLVRPRKYVELSQKICELINDDKLSKKMGMRGRKVVEKKFDIREKVRELIKVYKSLV